MCRRRKRVMCSGIASIRTRILPAWMKRGPQRPDPVFTEDLLRLGNHFTVRAALREEMFWVGLLKIAAADFIAGNLGCNGQDSHTPAVTVVESIDQMQIAGPATSGADRQSSGEMGFCASGKRRRLFMPHVNPLQSRVPPNGVGDPVE